MKKIFALLSLIAISTLAFTSEANTFDKADNIEIVTSDFEAPACVYVLELPTFELERVLNVTDETVNYTSIGRDLDLIVNIDAELTKIIFSDSVNKEIADKLLGIVNLLDSIQDYAVDVLGKDENEVFNLTQK